MKNIWLTMNVLAVMVGQTAWAGDIGNLNLREVPLKILTTETDGMTVYVFDNDPIGTSVCYDDCERAWPVVKPPEGELKAPLGQIVRKDGSVQLTFKNRPLYHFFLDSQPGDILGDGQKDVWHVVHP